MKKLLFLLLLCPLLFATSCKDKDKYDDLSETGLLGKWKLIGADLQIEMNNQEIAEQYKATLNSEIGHTVIEFDKKGIMSENGIQLGTYKVKDNTIYVTYLVFGSENKSVKIKTDMVYKFINSQLVLDWNITDLMKTGLEPQYPGLQVYLFETKSTYEKQ